MDMSNAPENESGHARRRVRHIVTGAVCIIILLTITGIYFEFNPTHLMANNVIVYALVNVNLILLLVLVLLVLRNLLKLYYERRRGAIGTKFRAKLVTAFVGLALTPSILLFVVANGLINRSIESWFNLQVESTLKDSQEVVKKFSGRDRTAAIQANLHACRANRCFGLNSSGGSLCPEGFS